MRAMTSAALIMSMHLGKLFTTSAHKFGGR